MSSLWTPEGERRVERSGGDVASDATQSDASYEMDESDVRRQMAEEMAGLEAELLAAPVEQVIANHCYGLFQLAALHLGQQPPNLVASRLAIDALGAIVDGLDNRLGESAGTLRDGLAQLRLAFVQISAATAASEDEEAPASETTEDPA